MTASRTDRGVPAAEGPVTAAIRGEKLAQLLQRVTALANRAVSIEEALSAAAADIRATMGWPSADVRPGSGETTEPWWEPAEGTGGGAGVLTVPVVAEDATAVVLRFSTAGGEPAPDVVGVLADIGRQLGVLVERNTAWDRLEELNLELERSNRELEQFAYVASHDLQEPLRKIIGFAGLLESRYRDAIPDEATEFLDIMVGASHRMSQLIEDLLAYSRAGRRRPQMGTVDLGEIVADVLGDLQPAIEESAGEVIVSTPLPSVHGNAGELRELLTNLVGNALKYHGDEPPHVDIGTHRQGDGRWRLTVCDDGIGIDPKHHDRIFDVFQRLHGRSEFAGTGIGLAICRQIVEHHGGRIWVESAPGEGSAFHVTLPPATTGPR